MRNTEKTYEWADDCASCKCECYVATAKRFTEFEYDGVIYHRVERKQGIDVIRQNQICVTTIEQTVVDSIRDFEKIAGLEEVLRCIALIPGLDEKKMLACLENSDNGFLYQKCGYLFENLREFSFSEDFFTECKRKSSSTKRYLMKNYDNNVYHKKWKLYAPATIEKLIENRRFHNYHITFPYICVYRNPWFSFAVPKILSIVSFRGEYRSFIPAV